MDLFRKRPSAGAVIGTIALFIALSGSAAALRGQPASPAAGLTWTKLTLRNGWTTYPGTRAPAVVVDSFGIVHFRGAMHEPSQSSVNPFRLPLKFRPAKDVYLPLDMETGHNGQMYIDHTTGLISLEEEDGLFTDAKALTSLDGASFSR